jgi:hemerythrin-like metal-binding protein
MTGSAAAALPKLNLHWSDATVLGFAPMDRCHAEFVDVVAALQAAPDDQVQARFHAVRSHLQAHFAQEEDWMATNNFPARACHGDEHAAVLKSAAEVEERLILGDFGACRRFADALANWFPGHADYMDAALAHWMCKLRYGGKPLVFRRTIATGSASTESVRVFLPSRQIAL